MRKNHIAAALLALAGASTVHAQTSVEIYGVIDTSVERLSNVDAAGNSLVRMPTFAGGIGPSRIGFRGEENLGNGLKAIFTLENGFGPDNGMLNQGNRMFGRQAFVGLSGAWGAVTVGRVYTMLFNSLVGVDVMGPSQYSIGSIDSYLPNIRSDNAISYKGSFNGFTGGATYSLGRDTSNAGGPPATNCGGEDPADHSACRQWSALLRYDGANWGVTAAYDTMNGGAGAAFNLNRSSLSDSRLHFGAYAKLAALTVAGGILRRNNEGSPAQPRSDLMYIGASYQLTPALVLDAEVAQLDFKHSPNDTGLMVLRATYNLSKRTAVYALLGRVQNTGTAANSLSPGATVGPGLTQTGIMTGIKHSF
jgi:predicted porin